MVKVFTRTSIGLAAFLGVAAISQPSMAQDYGRPIAYHSANKAVEAASRAEEERIDLQPLVSPAELAELMNEARPHIIDIRNPSANQPLFSYAAGHVPGSVNVPFGEWRKLWSDPASIPKEGDLTDFVRAAGLTKDKPIVIVHGSAATSDFGAAAWAYWLLKTAGFEQLGILNGGMRSWQASGQDISTVPTPIVRSFEVATLNTSWLATHGDVDAVLAGESDAQLLDARPPQQIARKASLQGSVMMDATDLITGEAGQVGELLDIFTRVKEAELTWEFGDVITYCNDGTLAALNWFMASEIAGIPNVRVYGHSLDARKWRITAFR